MKKKIIIFSTIIALLLLVLTSFGIKLYNLHLTNTEKMYSDTFWIQYIWDMGYTRQTSYCLYIREDGTGLLTSSYHPNFIHKQFKLNFSRDDITNFKKLIKEVDFFNLPQNLSCQGVCDAGSCHITIKNNENTYYQVGGYATDEGKTENHQKFNKLCSYLYSLISDEVKQCETYYNSLRN